MDGFYFVDSTTSDWDLQAIVKGCNSPDNMISKPSSYAWFQSRSHGEEYERCESEAFEPLKAVNSGTTSIHGHDDSKSPTRVQKKKAMGVSCVDSQGVTKERRRKPKQKISFVQQVAGDRALSDNWNWRKYGQKTIKGSPYPRSYYKCSSSGDCLARKQVEHSSNDPGTFLITYLNEHNHPYPSRRHSQAGRSKERFDASSGGLSTSKSSASTAKSSSLESPFGDNDCVLALKCDKDEGSLEDVRAIGEDGEVGVSDMAGDDEFFAGLEYLEGLEMDLLCDGF